MGKRDGDMQVGMNGRLSGLYETGTPERRDRLPAVAEWLQTLAEAAKNETETVGEQPETEITATGDGGSQAARIYEAATGGKENPVNSLRQASKTPYGCLAREGVIEYNGVCFLCDEKTNSICLGDMTNPEDVITVALSDGGHLKVNRDNLGDLAKAAGMFSPEDLNLIMRAIARDTKVQSMKQELEDMKGRVGSRLGANVRQETDKAENG